MRRLFTANILVFVLLFSTICSGQMRSQVQDKSHGSLHHLSAKEREWYHKFHNGLLLFDGWEEISKDILASLPQHKQDTAERLLQSMGKRIGMEWAKDNDTRRINTDMLRFWGERLKAAQETGASQMLNTVRAISTEVNALLYGEAVHPTS